MSPIHVARTGGAFRYVYFAFRGCGFAPCSSTWLEEKAAEEETFYDGDVDDDEDDEECDLDCSLGDIFMSRCEIPAERNSCDNFLEDGKTNADKRFFRGVILFTCLNSLFLYFNIF